MKKLQNFSDSNLETEVSYFLNRVKKLPLPYTGNKKKLLYLIYKTIIEKDIKFNSIIDACSGSASMSVLFKFMNKKVISNDILTSSYLNAVAFAENPGIHLTNDEKEFLLKNDNKNKNSFVEDNYLGTQFRKSGQNCRYNKFTLKECQHLDNFRANIEELSNKYTQSLGMVANASVILRLPFGNVDQSKDLMTHRKKQEKEYGKDSDKHDRRIGIYYDQDLNLNFDKWFAKYLNDFTNGISIVPSDIYNFKIKRANFLANLQQHILRDCMVQGRMHHGQAIAETDIRLKHQKNQLKKHWSNNGSTEMDFFTREGTGFTEGLPGQGFKWWSLDEQSKGSCLAVNMDIVRLLNIIDKPVDCIYFDPPYGGQSSDYATIYRFLEEYIYSKPLEDLPHIQQHSKRFVGKKSYETNFIEMLNASKNISTWMFSYNDQSWKEISYIQNIIKEFKDDVEVVTLTENYRYLYRNKQGRDSKSSEYLIIAR